MPTRPVSNVLFSSGFSHAYQRGPPVLSPIYPHRKLMNLQNHHPSVTWDRHHLVTADTPTSTVDSVLMGRLVLEAL